MVKKLRGREGPKSVGKKKKKKKKNPKGDDQLDGPRCVLMHLAERAGGLQRTLEEAADFLNEAKLEEAIDHIEEAERAWDTSSAVLLEKAAHEVQEASKEVLRILDRVNR